MIAPDASGFSSRPASPSSLITVLLATPWDPMGLHGDRGEQGGGTDNDAVCYDTGGTVLNCGTESLR